MELVYIVLVILCLISAINFKLTLNLLKIIRDSSSTIDEISPVHIGEKVPDIKGRRISSNDYEGLNITGAPSVLLFVSSQCPKCQEKIPQIEYLHPLMRELGICISIISKESTVIMKSFLNNSILLDNVWFVSNKNYKKLNPTFASPFYLFISHEAKLQAYGFIGDSDWESFAEQVKGGRDSEAVA